MVCVFLTKYSTIQELIEDIALVISNVRHIYPEDEQIYIDTLDIERVITKELGLNFDRMIADFASSHRPEEAEVIPKSFPPVLEAENAKILNLLDITVFLT